jgi:hypothetical protein
MELTERQGPRLGWGCLSAQVAWAESMSPEKVVDTHLALSNWEGLIRDFHVKFAIFPVVLNEHCRVSRNNE